MENNKQGVYFLGVAEFLSTFDIQTSITLLAVLIVLAKGNLVSFT